MRRVLLLIVLAISVFAAKAQNVLVSGALVGNGSYNDLGSAFTAINGGSQSGAAITIDIIGNTTEAASAVLNSGTWSSLSISPNGGAARTITGAVTGHLIDLNGASNITINGMNLGGNSLSISNTATGASSCIRFIADASFNTVTNCSILGSTTSLGNIFFSTGIATGNDNNNISNNDIGVAGTNFPLNCIYSLGTSAAIDNSSNIVAGNNVFDFFSASAASTGVNLTATGNSLWTIANNKFYQTAIRTYTTANTHSVINIASGNGYAITGNAIGYAASNGTGAYTMTGTIATRFIAIGLAVGTTTTTSVQGNTITAISLATSSGATTANGIICGINITSGNVNVGTISSNTIGVSSGINSIVATATTTGGLVVGINTSSTGTINIQNNAIGGLTSSGIIAGIAGSITAINVSGVTASLTISGNTIGNATTDNMRGGTSGLTTGSSLVNGIYMVSTPTAVTISNNTIQNLSSYGTGTAGYVRGIQTTTSGTTTAATINNNTIKNLSTNGAVVGYSSGQTTAAGIHFATGLNATIYQNTIFNISYIGSATTNVVAAGISMASAQNTSTYRNNIYSIANSGTGTSLTAPPIAVGILIRSGTITDSLYNNTISLGTGQTTNTCFIGIMCNHGSTPDPANHIYFNTIHIEGIAASGALPSFGLVRGELTATARTVAMNLQNNIFDNQRTGGTGKHYAIANNYGATTASATGWSANASNYNLLNSANYSTVGYWTTDKDFAAWKTASLSDGSSASGTAVTFVNPANNLHLNMGTTPTPIESGGVAITGITTDYDGQTRPGGGGTTNGGGTLPDIGADEFDGVPLDFFPPTISYTSIANTTQTTDRTITGVTITDIGGVNNTAGTKPRLYYKRSLDANTYNDNTASSDGWKYVEASNATSPFSFTTDYTLLNGGTGIAAGHIVQYFVIAQDLTSNVGINSGVFAANPTSVNLTSTAFPLTGTINSYTVLSTIAGTLTVGTGGTYPTLTGVGGAFADINSKAIGGNITLQIISNITTEDGSNALNAFIEEPSNSNFTLTIFPTGSAWSVTGTSTGALFKLNAADRVTIDGSLDGAGTDRSLTLGNNNTGTASAVLWAQSSGSDGATNNTFKNLIVTGNASTTTLVGIGFGSPTISITSLGTGNNNNTVRNNSIRASVYGIYSQGASAANKNSGNLITQNDINSVSPSNVGKIGMLVGFEDGIEVSSNNISGMNIGGDAAGIAFGTNSISTTSAGNEVTNAIVRKNNIGTVIATGVLSAVGIYAVNGSTGTNIIDNNVVTGVAGGNTTTDITAGIYIAGPGTATTKVYFNSVSMTGLRPGTASSYSFALAIGGTTPSVDVQNNILYNTQTSGSATGLSHAIGLHYTSTTGNYANLISNNNVLFVSGTHAMLARTGSLTGPSAGTAISTLANWNSATGRDPLGVSVNADPAFTSTTNLLPINGNDLIGANIATVTTDILGNSRLNPPAIGAYEISMPGIWSSTAASNVWETATNWRDGAVPTTGISVYIPVASTNMPTLASSPTLKRLVNNGTLTINGANTLSVSDHLYNNGLITGISGGLTLNGTTQQIVTFTGTAGSINIKDFTSNNTTNVTLSLGTGTGKLNITGTATLTGSGSFYPGGRFVLKSSASGTGRIGPMGTNITINGAITTEIYIPGGRRAFRFLSHPFTISHSLSEITDNIFVTGDGTNAGTGGPSAGTGFDATGTNAASSWWFDNTTNGWKAFTSTSDTNWSIYRGIRVLVRGDRTQTSSLTGGNPTPNPVTIDVTGIFNYGAGIPLLTPGNYHLVGNPLPSPVDIGTIIDGTANIGTQYWLWDANASTKGAYVTRIVSSGAYNLAMNSAFIVKPTATTGLTFFESHKVATATTNLFRSNAQKGILELQLLYNDYPADNMFVKVGNDAREGTDSKDGEKLMNTDMNLFATNTDNKSLSLDARPYSEGSIIPLTFTTTLPSTFKIKVVNNGLDESEEIYLKDKLLNTMTKLTTDVVYSFEVNVSNPATQGNNRFELVMKATPSLPVISMFSVRLSPNPAKDLVKVSFSNVEKANTIIVLANAEGKLIKQVDAGNVQAGDVTINLKGVAKGTYYLTLNNGTERKTEKLIVQ